MKDLHFNIHWCQVAGSEGSSSEDSQDSLTGVSRGHKRKLETILEEDRDIEQGEEDEEPGVKFRAGRGVPSDFEVSSNAYCCLVSSPVESQIKSKLKGLGVALYYDHI